MINPIPSMYGIFPCIYHIEINHSVGRYTSPMDSVWEWFFVAQVPPNFNVPLLGLRGMADATFRATALRQWHLGRCMEI